MGTIRGTFGIQVYVNVQQETLRTDLGIDMRIIFNYVLKK
jgi:hypothetical protein